MKPMLASLFAVGALAAAALPAAAAGPWQSIVQRDVALQQRIDQGVRSGQLTRAEAAQLQGDMRALERTEAAYSQRGFNPAERADLDRRFGMLSARIYNQKRDAQTVGSQAWPSIIQRDVALQQHIDQGIRSGQLTRGEAMQLQGDMRALERLEASYSQGGLNANERADLNHRFDMLSARIYAQKHDAQTRG